MVDDVGLLSPVASPDPLDTAGPVDLRPPGAREQLSWIVEGNLIDTQTTGTTSSAVATGFSAARGVDIWRVLAAKDADGAEILLCAPQL